MSVCAREFVRAQMHVRAEHIHVPCVLAHCRRDQTCAESDALKGAIRKEELGSAHRLARVQLRGPRQTRCRVRCAHCERLHCERLHSERLECERQLASWRHRHARESPLKRRKWPLGRRASPHAAVRPHSLAHRSSRARAAA
eukprot:534777-Pleurochrysis_carterae.AAC.3